MLNGSGRADITLDMFEFCVAECIEAISLPCLLLEGSARWLTRHCGQNVTLPHIDKR